jgi:hypothetical protein
MKASLVNLRCLEDWGNRVEFKGFARIIGADEQW